MYHQYTTTCWYVCGCMCVCVCKFLVLLFFFSFQLIRSIDFPLAFISTMCQKCFNCWYSMATRIRSRCTHNTIAHILLADPGARLMWTNKMSIVRCSSWHIHSTSERFHTHHAFIYTRFPLRLLILHMIAHTEPKSIALIKSTNKRLCWCLRPMVAG